MIAELEPKEIKDLVTTEINKAKKIANDVSVSTEGQELSSLRIRNSLLK